MLKKAIIKLYDLLRNDKVAFGTVTMDRQSQLVDILTLASIPDWKYPSKNEYPEMDKSVLVVYENCVFYGWRNLDGLWVNSEGKIKSKIQAWCYLPTWEN